MLATGGGCNLQVRANDVQQLYGDGSDLFGSFHYHKAGVEGVYGDVQLYRRREHLNHLWRSY